MKHMIPASICSTNLFLTHFQNSQVFLFTPKYPKVSKYPKDSKYLKDSKFQVRKASQMRSIVTKQLPSTHLRQHRDFQIMFQRVTPAISILGMQYDHRICV